MFRSNQAEEERKREFLVRQINQFRKACYVTKKIHWDTEELVTKGMVFAAVIGTGIATFVFRKVALPNQSPALDVVTAFTSGFGYFLSSPSTTHKPAGAEYGYLQARANVIKHCDQTDISRLRSNYEQLLLDKREVDARYPDAYQFVLDMMTKPRLEKEGEVNKLGPFPSDGEF